VAKNIGFSMAVMHAVFTNLVLSWLERVGGGQYVSSLSGMDCGNLWPKLLVFSMACRFAQKLKSLIANRPGAKKVKIVLFGIDQ
jgi:hypothetical protein